MAVGGPVTARSRERAPSWLRPGCPWRAVASGFGPAWPTAYRRFAQRVEARGRTGGGGDLPGRHQLHRAVSLRVHPAE
ncbi:transposase [Streptomyces sporangiiformans]|uniref:Transposase n=1 Tax=Streptomyces sporangiiformans TaxID=2315329 RepID=A0A505DRU2_9ACTN|nr:transposase [Streptomyces sporangiiformans]